MQARGLKAWLLPDTAQGLALDQSGLSEPISRFLCVPKPSSCLTDIPPPELWIATTRW